MFVLLHSISDTAFRTVNQSDFLTASISQIVYAFRSQAGMVFLQEEAGLESRTSQVLSGGAPWVARNELEHLSASPQVARF